METEKLKADIDARKALLKRLENEYDVSEREKVAAAEQNKLLQDKVHYISDRK